MSVKAGAALEVEGLSVAFPGASARAWRTVASGVDLRIAPGECLALVGGSGSGKSVTARSLVGLAGARARVSASVLRVGEREARAFTERQWRIVRGREVGLVRQDALVSLDPLRPIGREIDDALRLHTRLSAGQRRQRMLEALEAAGMPDAAWRATQRAGELSGGLRQRALIAAALVLDPPLVIADEPTTALDVGVQQQVLEALRRIRERGTAVLFISHDLGVVSRVADRVAVMHEGRIVETGTTRQVLDDPKDAYTRMLLAAIPAGRPRGERLEQQVSPMPTAAQTQPAARLKESALAPVLELVGVSRSFRTHGVSHTAVDDVSLAVLPGRTLGLVGESGSGKTTTARIALGLVAPDRGTVTLAGEPWAPLREPARRERRGRLGAVYQDALSSFDPRWSVGAILADALTQGTTRSTRAHADEVEELLRSVGLPADTMRHSPRALSGGQRQRVAIARAIAPRPAVLICDEPVSSLDVLVQARVLDLLDELQATLDVGYLFISHDLDVIRHMSDQVAVMHAGRIVESGEPERLFADPQHEYSRRLLSAR